MGIRKITPGGHEYLVGRVACGDRDLDVGETLADYYFRHGYPPGQWFGSGAAALGMTGEVSAAQMQALFGEGRHPDANGIEARLLAAGASPQEVLRATKLGNRFPRFGGIDDLRTMIREAYTAYNQAHGREANAPISETDRSRIRRDVQVRAFTQARGAPPTDDDEFEAWRAEQRRLLKNATAGYELVFAPPKSVSVAWGLGDSATRERIVEAHRRAVRDTLGYLERQAAFTRKGAGGIAQHDTRGIAATLFEHWDSRAADPHLHTHVPVSTKVQSAVDGKWTSVDGRTLLASAVTLSEFYNSRIRDLMREQGAQFRLQPHQGIDLKRPVWELDGVSSELLEGFSQRSAAVERERARGIVAYRRAHGREPNSKELLEIGRRAQYATRQAKPAESLPLAKHVARWRQEATAIAGAAVVGRIGERVFGARPATSDERSLEELAVATLTTVSEHYSHFNRWNLLAEAHRQSAGAAIHADERERFVDRIVQAVLDAPDTIALQAPSLVEEPESLRRASGESVFTEHGAERFTTHQTLREEAALAAWGQRRDGHRLTSGTVDAALARTELNDAQQAAVRGFATSGRRIQLLVAPAGTGKTTTMKVFADAWRSAGGQVYAFGPSARAAQELGQSIGARPHTLHQVTTALDLGNAHRRFGFTRGDVLIIDEAAMAGTHTLHTVVRYALSRGADVRMVGDHRQLSAVEAGGAVRWFAHQNADSVLKLREVVRFRDPDQAQASLLLHAAQPEGLNYYFARNMVQDGSLETMRDAAHRAWRADLDSGLQSLLIVPSNDDVVDLNVQARELRLARGHVDDERSVRLHDGTTAGAGDWVVTRHNDRLKTLFRGTDFVKNGDTWTVQRVHDNGSLVLRHQATGGSVRLPAEYVREHVELAYAATVNRVQGMTAEHTAHSVITRGISREQLYTMVTRARGQNRLWVETHEHTLNSHHETPLERTARGVLENALQRSSAETSASEELRSSLGAEESLRTLVARHTHVADLGRADRIDSVLTEHVPELLDLDGAGALRQQLRSAEHLGWQAERLIPELASGLDDADNLAALLTWRIGDLVANQQPPARTATPTAEQMSRWRSTIERHDHTAAPEDPEWNRVWERAAAAAAEGLDADAAIRRAAHALSIRNATDPASASTVAADVVAAACAEQRGHQPVPWLAHADFRNLSADEADYLHRLQLAITDRVTELRQATAANPPHWSTGLGPRPDEPRAALRWEELLGHAAAYRETYGIDTTDPARPLGEPPEGHNLRAQAWHHILDRWTPEAHPDTDRRDPNDRLREEFGEPLMATLTATDRPTKHRTEQPLSDTVHRREQLVRSLLDQAAREALAIHAPAALGAPAEEALLRALHDATRAGWQPHRLLPRLNELDDARDPAALLAWRIHRHTDGREPPAPTAEPTTDQIEHWKGLIQHAEQPDWSSWGTVWRHAAAASSAGLDTDRALTDTTHALRSRTELNPREVAQRLVDHLADQRTAGLGYRPALPWMSSLPPDIDTGQLDDLDHAIRGRLTELRDATTTNPPRWATNLPPRPDDPYAAEQWAELLTRTAAYRETYGVRTDHPDLPLGPQPHGDNTRTQNWHTLNNHWRLPMHPEHTEYTQRRLNNIRENLIDAQDDRRDDRTDQREHLSDEHHRLRAEEEHHHTQDHGRGSGLSHGA
ncbi:MobF family relaxase [Saccharopolyspora gloriosae]|nr:MobF family relaxase [Saccharopolyspora gloriosae]